jgi:hypothetical protein
MQYREVNGFTRPFRARGVTVYAALAAAFACFVLGGCSSVLKTNDDPTWPNMAKVLDPDNIMTPEQRQKAVQDMQKESATQSAPAAKPAGQ